MDSRFVALFVAFICVFAANNSEGRRKFSGSFLDNGVSNLDVQGIIKETTAEQAPNYCIKELKDNPVAVKDLDSSDLYQTKTRSCDGIKFDSTVSVERSTQKKAIMDFLKGQKLPSRASRDKHAFSSRKLFSVSERIPRRYLRRHRNGRHRVLITASTTPGPGPAISPAPNIAPSPMMHQVPSPSPIPQPSDTAQPGPTPPAPSDTAQPGHTPPAPPDTAHPGPTPVASFVINKQPLQLPKNISQVSPEHDNVNRKYMLTAIVACSVLALIFMALLLIVCVRGKKEVEPKEGQRDEKPLLNFSTSNISAGSSAHTLSNPSIKDFKAPSIAGLSPDANHLSSQAASEFESVAEAHAERKSATALPLPPGRTAPPPPGPPPPPAKPPAPSPPPPPKIGRRPPNPPAPAKLSPLGPHHRRISTGEASDASDESGAPKTKLKPFFWDKVLASPNHSMVWHEIKAGSFQFNEEMMESLFGYAPAEKNKNENKKDPSSFDSPPQFIQIIDPKKSQNLAILLKALNVTTEEVCDALNEGNELPAELSQTLLRMAPTADEELKLRLYSGDISHLGPAERFLKVMVDIPFAFKRLESLLFVSTFQEEFSSVKESLATLEVACKELRNSRLFLKLLEAVLKTGNRMNDGTYRGGAQAFKLDTLLKLSDVKGTDGKTTLLHFVVQEIIRSEGIRAARRLKESRSMSSVRTEDLADDSSNELEEYHRNLGLQVVSGLSSELKNVKKAAIIDNDSLSESVYKFGQALSKTKAFLETEMKSLEGESEFRNALTSFVQQCESDIEWLKDEEKRITALVKSTGDYFHGRAGREEGAHLFLIVRDFLLMLDKSCVDVKNSSRLPSKMPKKEASTAVTSKESPPAESSLDMHRRLFPAMRERQMDDDFSSDDED